MKKTIISSIACALLALSGAADATTITFESLAHPGQTVITMTSYQEKGFQFTAPTGFGSVGSEYVTYAGSASLYLNHHSAAMTLSRIDGKVFTLNSIDLAPLLSWFYGNNVPVTFVGQTHGGGQVTQSFKLSSDLFQTFTFSGFNNLDSVSWTQAPDFHQFDNVVLDANVPEPASLALTGLALAALGLVRRRRA